MVTITGGKCNTITLEADEVYALVLAKGRFLDIANASTGTLYVSEKNDFSETNGVGGYISISSGGAYNSFPLDRGNTLYMKSTGSGSVSVILRRC